MSRLQLLWVGRDKGREPENLLCDRYLTRIQSQVKLEVKAVKPLVAESSELTRKRESDKLRSLLSPKDYVILLDERGKQYTSVGFAEFLQKRREQADGRLVFIIGGASGVDSELRRNAHSLIALSAMTLPHAMARALFMEQLYRALCITSGHPYHHV